MKKIFLFYLLFIGIMLQGNKVWAQTTKLNNAFNHSYGIVVDSKGNAFVTGGNSRIIKITPNGKAELFAGGGRNSKDGKGKEAGLGSTRGICIDSADNIYITDDAVIRKITPDATVTTIAGNKIKYELVDGDRTTASFHRPEYITIDNSGTIYVTDEGFDKTKQENFNVIRKITPNGLVTTLKAVPGGETEFRSHWIRGIVCDKERNLYVCALGFSSCIKKIRADGTIFTLTGKCDATRITAIFKEGDIATAQIVCPTGIALNKKGELFFSDVRLHRIVKIADNKVTTVAGNNKITTGNIAGGADPGYEDGKAKQALFYSPAGIAFDKSGNLYIVDGSSRNNSYIRKLSTDGTVSTFCMHSWNPKTQQYEETD